MSVSSRNIISFFRTFDWVFPIVVFVLTVIGIAAIYSVDLSRGDALTFFPTQVTAFAIGICVFFFAASLHVTVYQSFARIAYLFAASLLGAVLFFGTNVRGTMGWFRFGGVSFQPAEFAKVGLILFLAWLISRHGRRFDRPQFVISTGLATIALAGLILLQPDLGSALILIGIWVGLLFLSGTRKRYVALIFVAGITTFAVGWFFLFAPYQKERVLTFLDPARDPLGGGYNVTQSMIAIGAGQVFGRGLGFGSQSQLHFLPETQTDFIFSVIAEELGFVAVTTVLGLYMLVLWRLLVLARACFDDFRTYVTLGIMLVFFVQIILNVGAAIGLLPVTGIPLPFLSYGGSSLIMNFLLIGIAESVARSVARGPDYLIS
jgi:rod shape determining protein RodA